MSGPIVVVGDALLDIDLLGTTTRLCPDAPVPVVDDVSARPRPGGAALAAYLAATDAATDAATEPAGGREVVLIAPLADDDAAQRLRELLAPYVRVIGLPWHGTTPVKTRIRAAGQSLLRVDTGGGRAAVGELPAAAHAALGSAAAVLVADYGRGATAAESVRTALRALPARVPVVWDPHPLGARPVPGVRLATPNRAEAARFAPGSATGSRGTPGLSAAAPPAARPAGSDPRPDTDLQLVSARGAALVRTWEVGAVAVTLGAAGALLSYGDGAPLVVPAPSVVGGDPCGAGDRFAAAAAALLARGALPSEAVQGAVAAASAFVAAGGAAALRLEPAAQHAEATSVTLPLSGGSRHRRRGPAENRSRPLAGGPGAGGAAAVVARVRAGGGVVVATGGCFDLLHAGHVATLQAARALGNCLVVCLNSDASVQALKGPDRPLQRQEDRAQVLEALACVDAVAVFDEATPETVLDRLRPDIWVKGGDYAGVELPENRLLRSWGGTTVVLPYLDGRSTSLLVKAARESLADQQAQTSRS